MPQRDQVVLRVRAYGQEGLEFALSGVNISEKRYTAVYCLISAFVLVVGGLLSSIEWDVIPSARLFVGLLLLTFSAAWITKATGRVIVEEAMLVVPSLGVRLSKKHRSGELSSKFVDLDKICGVAVNEAITFSSVVYSLVLMVEGQDDMVLPFETFQPQVAVLQEIFLETKRLLFPVGSDRQPRLPTDIAPTPC
ncbi:unnamed protein product [Hyaloperonospora brassicae]|uniref:Phosphatidylinositol N-acetylglucosaminyltransferase subunit H conserved domain-containing protein n=1 Tax=Hyaloperonospora brassicae TaxID=162125 RepID=A0AAV0TYL1_HYABA|nr:unnamed protein product [Hyaloperonospora brassicae]